MWSAMQLYYEIRTNHLTDVRVFAQKPDVLGCREPFIAS